jgi:hypothetical protein
VFGRLRVSFSGGVCYLRGSFGRLMQWTQHEVFQLRLAVDRPRTTPMQEVPRTHLPSGTPRLLATALGTSPSTPQGRRDEAGMRTRLYVTRTIQIVGQEAFPISNVVIQGIPPTLLRRMWLRLLVWCRLYREVRTQAELWDALR